MKLFSINAGFFKLDGGAMFGVVPKSIWNKLNPADENNMCTWAMRCMLIDTGEKRILIDTGMGDKQDAKFFSHYYIHGNDTLDSSLAQHGYTKDDITDVFHTHLHFDHCGGTIIKEGDGLVPAFKNARLWSNEQHWNWATNPNDREKASFLKENILPILESGKLQFAGISENFKTLGDNISLKFAYGHTDAMMLPTIKYKGRTIVYMADLLPSTAHLPLPYVMGYDMFPLKTLNEKKIFLQETLDNDYILFLEHDPKVECCTLQMTEKGIRVKDTFKLEEL
jgi:glyoxylase-like metal-dependent hydrolase (beta-lactamase superfamily II)